MSPIRLSCAIMAHPTRVDRAAALQAQHPELSFRLALDPQPDGPPAAIRAARVAWASVDVDATHHLVVQEDAVLAESFADRVRAAIEARPRDALCLFTEWGSDSSYAARLAALCGNGFAEVIDYYVPSVALVLPANIALDFAATESGLLVDDVALHDFLGRRGVRACVVVPNLADHDGEDSLVGNGSMGARRSVCFGPHAPLSTSDEVVTDMVPVMSTLDFSEPRCLVRTGPADGWERGDPFLLVQRHGIEPGEVQEMGRLAIDRYADGLPTPYPYVLFSLWLTAFGLGLLSAKTLAGQPIDAVLDRPIVAAALETMPAGAFRDYLVPAGPGFNDVLRTVTRLGVRDGYEAGQK